MKYNIHVTQAAERDMANAYDYIDLVLKNPTAADKLLDVADEKIGALAEFPHKFEVVSDKLGSMVYLSVQTRLVGRINHSSQFACRGDGLCHSWASGHARLSAYGSKEQQKRKSPLKIRKSTSLA